MERRRESSRKALVDKVASVRGKNINIWTAVEKRAT
jgi:hypothetical protein